MMMETDKLEEVQSKAETYSNKSQGVKQKVCQQNVMFDQLAEKSATSSPSHTIYYLVSKQPDP